LWSFLLYCLWSFLCPLWDLLFSCSTTLKSTLHFGVRDLVRFPHYFVFNVVLYVILFFQTISCSTTLQITLHFFWSKGSSSTPPTLFLVWWCVLSSRSSNKWLTCKQMK
jgi:hypothetical protein